MMECWIEAYTLSCAAGVGLRAVRDAVAAQQTGLRYRPWPAIDIDSWVGPVPADLDAGWPADLAAWDSRNNRLAWLGLQQDGLLPAVAAALGEWGPSRVGLVVGTSTSSIGRTEEAYRDLAPAGTFAPRLLQPTVHNPDSTGAFLARMLGIEAGDDDQHGLLLEREGIRERGPLAERRPARRGADCWRGEPVPGRPARLPALQLLSRNLCRPFDANRDGLNIGEAAGLRTGDAQAAGPATARLLGYGEPATHTTCPARILRACGRDRR